MIPGAIVGYFDLFLAQFSVGVSIVLAKYLVKNFPILLLLELRFLLGGLMVLAMVRMAKLKVSETKFGDKLKFRDWWVLFLQALCGGFLFNVFILYGLNYTTATMAGIITSTVPAGIVLFSYLFLKERITALKGFSIIVAILGLMVISVGKGDLHGAHINFLGDFLVLMAVFPEALFTVLAKWHGNHMHPYVMAFLANLFNVILFLPFAVYDLHNFNFSMVTWSHWALLFFYAVSGGIIFFVCWYRGLENVSASTAALMTAIMPVGTTVLAWMFLNEQAHWYVWAGMLCVILSIVLGSGALKHIFGKKKVETIN